MDPLCSTGIDDVQFAAMLQHIKHHLNFSLLQHTHTPAGFCQMAQICSRLLQQQSQNVPRRRLSAKGN